MQLNKEIPGIQRICVGKINGLFGVKGWVKVFSYTRPRENILSYSPWILVKGDDEKEIKVASGKVQGKSIVAEFDAIQDRDMAGALIGYEIYINHSQLPEIAEQEYYWYDLVGLQVETIKGIPLGIVDYLIETGANDVLVVAGERERLIPFLKDEVVQSINLDSKIMVVDWDPDF